MTDLYRNIKSYYQHRQHCCALQNVQRQFKLTTLGLSDL